MGDEKYQRVLSGVLIYLPPVNVKELLCPILVLLGFENFLPVDLDVLRSVYAKEGRRRSEPVR
jgi:hypothetical protein